MRRRCVWVPVALSWLWLAPPVQAYVGYGIVTSKDGGVAFTDSARSRVWRLDENGRLTTLAHGIHGDHLVADHCGNLYIENVNATLWQISAEGHLTRLNVPGKPG